MVNKPMKPFTRTKTALAFAALLCGGTSADEISAPPADTLGDESAPPPGENAVDYWEQTKLSPAPALQEQYKKTRTFLNEKVSEVDDQISQLKSSGALGRRSATAIRSALNNARVSMSGMAGGMQEEEPVDGWTARMFAYELGMAADTLTGQAEKIETNLSAPREAEPQDGQPRDPVQQRQLAQTLKEASALLRKTAQAITDNLE